MFGAHRVVVAVYGLGFRVYVMFGAHRVVVAVGLCVEPHGVARAFESFKLPPQLARVSSSLSPGSFADNRALYEGLRV